MSGLQALLRPQHRPVGRSAPAGTAQSSHKAAALWPWLLQLLLLAGQPHLARAEAPPVAVKPHWASTLAWFATGAVGAFVAHESGHLMANAMLGNRPRLVAVPGLLGIPFFAISPEIACSRLGCRNADGLPFRSGAKGQFFIAAAGFNMQHITSEIILSARPQLRFERGPMAKGWLAFNVLLSLGYVAASVAGVEDDHGDFGGATAFSHWPKPALATLLLAPAALDVWRYWRPSSSWAPWASRGGKLAFFGVAWLI